MEHKKLNRVIAGGVFLVSLITYMATLSPTVVFWDVGEFSAAAFSLQVPHPPGAPLFLLLARLASMVPFVPDIAVRMHFVSGLASALSCGLLYLLSVKFIVTWRGIPGTTYDRIVVFGSAVVGALSLTFSPTFWFNAVEAEVYGMSMLFVSGIIWLGMRWYERADFKRGDMYLLFIAYLVGLAVGVHLLAILALFPVMLFYYFRYNEFSIPSFLKFGVAAMIIFGIIYPGVVKVLPSLLDGEFGGTKSELFTFMPIALIGAAFYGIYYSVKKQNRLLNLALLSFLLIILGYSTYTMVYIRANANPPMNENDPSTMARLVSYLNREQYGEAPLINRRWNTEPEQSAAAAKYAGDLDYFWKYQLNHMYLRYFGWNYVGSEGDFKDAGVNWKQLYGIPLFLGLLGAFFHWRRDPKMAAVASATFLVMGLALVVYFNMQEPQPRERDYFYVGSFFIFSMWIGMGVLGAIDWIKEKYKSNGSHEYMGYAVLVLAVLFVPVNMFRTNYHQADRKGNYVAWDYSYNLLQTCEQDAILFTNGDNDTFPLWYLQDVEGVRRDVRVVCLSLLNTSWYIKELKHREPYGAKKVPITTPDGDIEVIRPREFQPRVIKLPVPGEIMRKYSVEGTAATLDAKTKVQDVTDTMSFYMPNSLEFGKVKAIRVQDIMVFDIVASSNWQRPIYFAMTVSPDGQIGLKEYLQLEGLAFHLIPRKGTSLVSNINEPKMRAQFFTDIQNPSKTPAVGYRWRGLQDSTTYFDEDIRRLMTNYRQAFVLLSQYYANTPGMMSKVSEPLDRMEQVVPRKVIAMDYRTKIYVANLYAAAGRDDKFRLMCNEIVGELKPIVERGTAEPLSYENPYVVLLQTYETLHQYDDALKLVDVIRSTYPREQGIEQITGQLRARLMAEKSAAQQKDSLATRAPVKGK
ncbi:MAG: DUF2723 domain-containing protein [Ignavibacteriales bacterium]|nr:DUF2723 domain-containing protein [Ignavibacteriales bacterium]